MDRVLIVARMNAADVPEVKKIWEESDASDLPGLVGVRSRSLFHFHGLYFHLIEADEVVTPNIEAVRRHPLFRDIDTKLATYVKAYDAATWRGPKDAMANLFYSWQAA